MPEILYPYMKIMKSLFTVIIIFLLPLSVYGIEWTVKYEMIKTNGDLENVTVSVPNDLDWEIPYLNGKYRCITSMFFNSDAEAKQNYFYSTIYLNCHLKENHKVTFVSQVGCDNGYIRDTKENELIVGLFAEGMDPQGITLSCKL